MKVPTFDMEEYDEMIKIIDENNLVCQVELEMHYNPVIVRLKELVENGEIGKIKSFNATNITLSPVGRSRGRVFPKRATENVFR